VLGAGLGLRQAEASGLTADRVLWLARAVRVDRQWNSRQRPAGFAPPKTRSSDRTVPASEYMLAELGGHVGKRHEGFVLHRDGEPMDWQAFGHQWRQTRKRAALSAIRFHDLRHAFASMLISAGCSVKAVSGARALVGGDDVEPLLAPVARRRGPDPGRHRAGAGSTGC
jgi:integrase